MADNRLSQAILAVESGDKAKARELLASVLRQDPKSADAWRWMAIALDDPDKKRQCWVRVLRFRPGDEQAIRALAELEAEQQAVVPQDNEVKELLRRADQRARRAERAKEQARKGKQTRFLLFVGACALFIVSVCVCGILGPILSKSAGGSGAPATQAPTPIGLVESDSESQQSVAQRVEDSLQELGYDVIGAQATVDEYGEYAIVVNIEAPESDLHNTLVELTGAVSFFVASCDPPPEPQFDIIMVLAYSGEEIVGFGSAGKKDIEAWMSGNISLEEFQKRMIVSHY